MEDLPRIVELRAKGLFCSQILVQMGLDLQGKTNPDLVRSTQALAGGLGFSGHLCGALTGGACLLGLCAGHAYTLNPDDERLNIMVMDLVSWFKESYGARYGGVDCDTILDRNLANISSRCPEIVLAVYQKSKQLLVEYGFDLSGSEND